MLHFTQEIMLKRKTIEDLEGSFEEKIKEIEEKNNKRFKKIEEDNKKLSIILLIATYLNI